MDIKQRQQEEKNGLAFVVGIIILGLLNIMTLVGYFDATANRSLVIGRTVINVILLIKFSASF